MFYKKEYQTIICKYTHYILQKTGIINSDKKIFSFFVKFIQ